MSQSFVPADARGSAYQLMKNAQNGELQKHVQATRDAVPKPLDEQNACKLK
ncbi:MAG: hypothetical protein H0W08_21265 [Acidobacteria bacterium]|nr:hypothetical protein [Acidobacteriota bacterium]